MTKPKQRFDSANEALFDSRSGHYLHPPIRDDFIKPTRKKLEGAKLVMMAVPGGWEKVKLLRVGKTVVVEWRGNEIEVANLGALRIPGAAKKDVRRLG